MGLNRKNLFHKLFKVSIILKGLYSLLEIISGILLFFITPASIGKLVSFIFQHELIEDPNDLIGNYLISLSSHLSISTQLFGAIYLLSHGVIKAGLVIGLLKKKLWTYIAAEVVFIIFIIYQIYRFSHTHSIFLLFLTLFDLLVIFLIWVEYKAIKSY